MKLMQKYFLAFVPEGTFQDQVTNLKLEIKDRFQAKFALKSPAHITLKMPFIYNEAKQNQLIDRLRKFVSNYETIPFAVKGVKTFGDRVIYLGIEAGQELDVFQRDLKYFCKKELNLVDELSDRNFHPHMTIAFKDIKKGQFQNILEFASEVNLKATIEETHVALLKKIEGRWVVLEKLPFKILL